MSALITAHFDKMTEFLWSLAR